MQVYIFAGKGGVGKTTSAVSLALCLSTGGDKTAIIDYDGGHSVRNTLGIAGAIAPNTVCGIREGIDVVVLENADFISIIEAQERSMSLEAYLEQFPADQGIVPLADMVNAFFGVPTDVPTLQKFAGLVCFLSILRDNRYAHVIIDVEPTAGFERLLRNASATARSLRNLKDQGRLKLAMLGVKWPDIAGYLKGSYIKDADAYSSRIERTVDTITDAIYFIVCTPEVGPVSQTFEIRKIIDKFGGTVHAYVVNNARGESYERGNIDLLMQTGLPLVTVMRRDGLHIPGNDRSFILRSIGKIIAECL